MKRFWSLLAAMLLLGNIAVTAWASEGTLAVSDTEVQVGQTVYVTVSVTEEIRGNTMGITYDYDTSVMKVIPSECQWKKKAALKDFSTDSSQGVWASDSEVSLRGAVCVLAFEVLPGMTFENSEVTCELLVKRDARQVGQYRATGLVSVRCAHRYGDWEAVSDALHGRVCADCGAIESQTHSWGETVTAPDPENAAVILQTVRCGVCSGEKVTRFPGQPQEVHPSQPEHTHPTQPSVPLETMPIPTVPEQKPTEPSKPTVPTEPVRPTEPTVPTSPNQNENGKPDQSQRPEPTEPSVYQPRDYNAPEETEAAEREEIHIHADGTVHKITSDRSPADEQVLHSKDTEKAAEISSGANPAEPVSSETDQEDSGRSTVAVLIIAAGCICAMVFICMTEKKRS